MNQRKTTHAGEKEYPQKRQTQTTRVLTYRPAREINIRLRAVMARTGNSAQGIIDACLAQNLRLRNDDWIYQLKSIAAALEDLKLEPKEVDCKSNQT